MIIKYCLIAVSISQEFGPSLVIKEEYDRKSHKLLTRRERSSFFRLIIALNPLVLTDKQAINFLTIIIKRMQQNTCIILLAGWQVQEKSGMMSRSPLKQ